MLTPRIARPHTVKVVNVIPPEDPLDLPSEITTILEHVSFQGKRKNAGQGVNTEEQESFICVIDCTDMSATYTDWRSWDKNPQGWTVHPLGDKLIHNGQEYAIQGFNILCPFGNDPQIIELTCIAL